MTLNPKFNLPPTIEEVEPWRNHGKRFFAFSFITIRNYYKEDSIDSHDLFMAISQDYQFFLSEVYDCDDKEQSFSRQATNFYLNLID